MTITDLSWTEAMNAVRGARKHTNPNFGFQRQLQNYEYTRVKTVS
jgi:atypical dual specificity phosphatase